MTETATFYAAYDPATGAPIGGATSETSNYRNGQSSITTYAGTTTDYSGPDGTGTEIPAITGATQASRAAAPEPAGDTIVVTGMGQMINPGSAGVTIRFLSGAADDTVVLQAGRADTQDPQSLFASAGVGDTGGDLTLPRELRDGNERQRGGGDSVRSDRPGRRNRGGTAGW